MQGGGRGQGEEEKLFSPSSALAPSPALWPVITFIAARDIEPGEELTISYGEAWWEEASAGSEEEEGEEEEGGGGEEESAKKEGEGEEGARGMNDAKKKPHHRHHRRRKRPTHSHMDDEDAFLGAMTLGGD